MLDKLLIGAMFFTILWIMMLCTVPIIGMIYVLKDIRKTKKEIKDKKDKLIK